ncbi:hypothetical protein ACFSO7_04240 [Bacillus sp. CGMCC 1.16607]|uniref:hypothetical protein n=1 Tax=Bacillus sp. CGMCC 1.16607 TaxID=3351842 RepID=UPI00364222FC
MIAYLNLFTIGNGIMGYLSFIIQRLECYLFPLGIMMVWFSIYFSTELKKD